MTQAQIIDPVPPVKDKPKPTRRRRKKTSSLFAQGEPLIWLTAGCLVISVLMIVGLLGLVLVQGVGTFWPQPLVKIETLDGKVFLGEVTRSESFMPSNSAYDDLPQPAQRQQARATVEANEGYAERRLLRTGNYDLTGIHFNWVTDYMIAEESTPEWGLVLERTAWGRFYGTPGSFVITTGRRPGQTEAMLKDLAALFYRYPGAFDQKDQQQLEALKQTIAEALDQRRRFNSKTFIEQFEAADDATVTVTTTDGKAVPLEDAGGVAGVESIRQSWDEPAEAWQKYGEHHEAAVARRERIEQYKRDDIGDINHAVEQQRLEVRRVELDYDVKLLEFTKQINQLNLQLALTLKELNKQKKTIQGVRDALQLPPREDALLATLASTAEKTIAAEVARLEAQRDEVLADLRKGLDDTSRDPVMKVVQAYLDTTDQVREQTDLIQVRISDLEETNNRYALHMVTVDNQEQPVLLADIVRGYRANRLSVGEKLGIYVSRWWEFLSDDPREANSEGGVFPAIFGTVMMTLLMSFAVVPFGVLAALYLREYAKAGAIVSAVRIAINNLAGVPSIVFGVFGLGFFCYGIGSFIDGGPAKADIDTMAPTTWNLWLAALLVVVAVAILLSVLSSRHSTARRGRRNPYLAAVYGLWAIVVVGVVILTAMSPYFEGFYRVNFPNPTFGKGALLWASATLALLTLPVVIVATEEALSAVPNSMREGSYAAGASKWQTIKRIVLPRAMPGIMTGMILAMARGAGEVAPLMLVGAVKMAPELPIASSPPFGANRSFMHLGFHIYDLGFQSQNSEAAKPMVYTTTLLLILIITLLNVAAIWLRSRLRRKFVTSQF